ncbi:hypothetical protein JRQ81_019359, partial [Phrynocephalus forsythii]
NDVGEIQAELMTTLNQRVDQMETLAEQNEGKTDSQHQRLEKMHKKIIYLEDNSKCSNIKIMNFELQKGGDLKQDMMTWINNIIKRQHVEAEGIERIHFGD